MKKNTFWFRIISLYEHYTWLSESVTNDDKDIYKAKSQNSFNLIINTLGVRDAGLIVMLHAYVMLTNMYILDREKHEEYAEKRAYYFVELLFKLNSKELTT